MTNGLPVISSVVEKSQRSLHALRLVEMMVGRGRLVEMTRGVWHTIEALEPGSVIFECKEGPFVEHEVDGILNLDK